MQIMADQKDTDALAFELLDQLGDHGGFLGTERRGGFVHDEDFGVEVNCSGDGDGLPLTAGHIFNRIGDVFKIGIQPGDDLAGFIFHGTIVEGPVFGHNFPAQKQIAGRIQIVGQGQGLVYGFDAVFACITGRLDAHFFTIDANLALVAGNGPESAFINTVFPAPLCPRMPATSPG
jgi:hypothetical protein